MYHLYCIEIGVNLFESRLKEAHVSGAGHSRPDVLTQLVRCEVASILYRGTSLHTVQYTKGTGLRTVC